MFCGSYVTKDNTELSNDFVSLMTNGPEKVGISSSGSTTGSTADDDQKADTKDGAKEAVVVPVKQVVVESKRASSKKAAKSPAKVAVAEPVVLTDAQKAEAKKKADDAVSAGLARAVAHKDKLIRFGQRGERAQVIDDQADYYEFENNVWMNEEQKKEKEAKAKLYEQALHHRGAHTITIDIANQSVRVADKDVLGNALPDIGDLKSGKISASQAAWVAPSSAGMTSGVAGSLPVHHESHYYTNDTLTGRAKKMYEELKESLRNGVDV